MTDIVQSGGHQQATKTKDVSYYSNATKLAVKRLLYNSKTYYDKKIPPPVLT